MKIKRNISIITCVIILLISPGLLIGCLVSSYFFAFSPNEIHGRSMEPNYNSGEFYITNKLVYTISNPKRFDAVVYNNPLDEGTQFIGRILGLPGEEIQIGSHIKINGETIEESYLDNSAESDKLQIEAITYHVGEEEYFILGDNRSYSIDSRKFGSVKRNQIVGKLWFCYAYCKD